MASRINHERPTLEQAIGRVLCECRKARKLTQIEVAAITNFGVRSIGKMERGNQSMTIRSLDALAMFYSLPIEEIIVRAKKLITNEKQ